VSARRLLRRSDGRRHDERLRSASFARAALTACLLASGVPLALAHQVREATPTLDVRVAGGMVSVTARDVPAAAILAEWARVGRVAIVDPSNVPAGPPVSITLSDVPEGKLLDGLLGDVVGYVVTLRPGPTVPDASVFERVLVLRERNAAADSAGDRRPELGRVEPSPETAAQRASAELGEVPAAPMEIDQDRPERIQDPSAVEGGRATAADGKDDMDSRGELAALPNGAREPGASQEPRRELPSLAPPPGPALPGRTAPAGPPR
jgi:hypothetical protein